MPSSPCKANAIVPTGNPMMSRSNLLFASDFILLLPPFFDSVTIGRSQPSLSPHHSSLKSRAGVSPPILFCTLVDSSLALRHSGSGWVISTINSEEFVYSVICDIRCKDALCVEILAGYDFL